MTGAAPLAFLQLEQNQWDHMLLRIPELATRDRRVFEAVLWVLLSGIPWSDFPEEELGMSHRTPWNRYRQWQKQHLWQVLLDTYLETLSAEQRQGLRTQLEKAEQLRSTSAGSRKRSHKGQS